MNISYLGVMNKNGEVHKAAAKCFVKTGKSILFIEHIKNIYSSDKRLVANGLNCYLIKLF